MVEDGIGRAIAAIDALDKTLVDIASDVAAAADRLEFDRREHDRYAALLAEEFDPRPGRLPGNVRTGGDAARPGAASPSETEQSLAHARRLVSSLMVLAQTVRETDLTAGLQSDSDSREANTHAVSLRRAMETAREGERSRLAREIHDGPAQVLANALFVVGIAERTVERDPAAVMPQLATIRDLLRDGIAEIRRFMFELRPSILEDQGIVATLRYYVAEYGRVFGTLVSLTIDEHVPVLSAEQELCLFRVVQEALQNIRTHAHVTAAHISLHQRERWLVLRISDAGRGFDPAAVIERGHGVGLRGMRERATLIGAGLVLDSSIDTGTTIQLSIPLSSAAAVQTFDHDDLGMRGEL